MDMRVLRWTAQASAATLVVFAAAYDFGRRLACTHDAGADAFGAPPNGWTGPGYFGPLHRPLPMAYSAGDRWGSFYANERLSPMADRAATRLDVPTREAVDTVIERCAAGDFDDDEPPARLHGDLRSGNVMWTPTGAVLIDPAPHGGHRRRPLWSVPPRPTAPTSGWHRRMRSPRRTTRRRQPLKAIAAQRLRKRRSPAAR